MRFIGRAIQSIVNWFRFDDPPQTASISFGQCYAAFRALLTANNNALELMASMEQTMASGRPFGMTFVRGVCTALSVNVYKMIRHLQELSGGGYQDLNASFSSITSAIEAHIGNRPPAAEGVWILPMSQIDRSMVDQVGEKMANLGEIRNTIGLKTPEGFAITAAASEYFTAKANLQDEINRRLTTMGDDDLEALCQASSAIQRLIISADLPPDLEREIVAAHQLVQEAEGGEVLVAMRSSALGEDSGSASFAGQYRTQLNVSPEFVVQTYKEIVAGKYKSQAIVYRLHRGYRHQDVVMCVGCLAMVDAVVSGVIYSRPPASRRSGWVEINAVAGLACQVVDGNVATDYLRVSRTPPHEVISKTLRQSASGGGVGAPMTVSDAQASQLARIALQLEQHFGEPQDVEWSIDRDGDIVILQSRPLGVAAVIPPQPAAAEDADDGALLAGGVTASLGVASGPVCVVRSNVDLMRFPKGSVLVVVHPLPEWAVLLNRAVAVISESGQVAAHLATVAREFGVPAIFGLDGAIAALADGDAVTVDATDCRVYQGMRQEIIDQGAQAAPSLMIGSPIHKLLNEVMELVAPLNLTDPNSLYFTPFACRTLHDLTRFCHEKAVVEMFSYGSRYGFDEQCAKQLVGDLPYQWWVIDLDDGFASTFDKKEKLIPISAIESQPMLAIWEGMTAIPWAGPPPISLSGFGSILFRSTMNRNLEASVRSSLTERNYFMVSKSFCNASVRLGYHFLMIEAHLSEFLTENYISFQFKGGAADEYRRRVRIELIKAILGRYDFRVEQKADALTARIEKKAGDYLLARLRVLGYLVMHTRQIDMVMGDRTMVEHYREKILADLRRMVPDCGDAEDAQ